MSIDLIDVFGPPAVALVVLALCWLSGRSINMGHRLSAIQKKMIWYAPLLVLGVGYLALIARILRWPDWIMYTMIAGWGVVLALIAWRLHRRNQPGNV
jgi:ABC-type Fe3+ transport system permease subunit